MRRYYQCVLLLLCCVLANRALSQHAIKIERSSQIYKPVPGQIEYLEDKNSSLSFQDVIAGGFKPYPGEVPNFFISQSTFWVKINLENQIRDTLLFINVSHSTLDEVVLYKETAKGWDSSRISEMLPFENRYLKTQSLVFPLVLSKGDKTTCYFKFRASEQILFPIEIGSRQKIRDDLAIKDLIFGIYIGLILFMLLYNSFLFFSTKELSYFYYVGYILFVGLSQCMLQGYTFRFLWPNTPVLNNYAAVIIPFLNGITAAEFIKNFLNLKQLSRKMHFGLTVVEILYCVSFVLCLLQFWQEAQIAVQLVASGGSLYMFIVLLLLRKNRGAQILLIAWTLFLASVVTFVLRNVGVLPYNDFTYYALQIGSAIEAILLSIALADKINIYRNNALEASLENERLVREQNIMLERQVKERTRDLQVVKAQN